MPQTLCGNTIIHRNNLLGKNDNSPKGIPLEIKNLKIKIMNNIILPLISKQWKQLHENMFFLENMKAKLDNYYKLYKMDDLLIYKDIVAAFELIFNEHRQLEDLEKQVYSSKNGDFMSIVYKTTTIKLKPEYELYDAIFGKPKRDKNQIYNDSAVIFIRRALTQENITFKKIKDDVLLQFTE